MRFGAFVPQGWRLDLVDIPVADHWETMAGVAQAIEAAGYESLWVYDHFHTVPVATQEVTYEAWSLMAALAAVTSRVRLGQMCTCNSYRPPAYLAKVAAGIDVISGGRVEMGIGAGWYEHEYQGYGYDFPKPSVRIGMLREAVEIMRRLWTEEEVSFEGTYYRLDGAICSPRPVQEPHIPFWIAGGGEKLTLNVAARYAAYTNFGGASVEEFARKSDILRGHCEDVGTDFDAITRSTNFNVVCAGSEAEVEETIAAIRDRYRPFVDEDRLDGIEAMVRPMAGTPEQIVERLRPWAQAGMEYAIVYFPQAAYDRRGLELFAREVIPAFS
ncbi:MAG: LLM class F420-dependent oxidoreductase [Acidimicrobiia bacterium]|nr:LLM class F420-dependent oxidoreductase [Acidimicrobiia bacterium]MBT8216014.1 LLM class F420-dependent oxidoreductase [Acidimicrobiia bacterium]NNF10743.1 LLM class F420-dependent oxidoreductase [Acidimicrobiia bacterium]NNL69228.1 LLM class F420-dependent oxidoreductase [Acidimicrobiia bacterium]